jgi:hypothetical protein
MVKFCNKPKVTNFHQVCQMLSVKIHARIFVELQLFRRESCESQHEELDREWAERKIFIERQRRKFFQEMK